MKKDEYDISSQMKTFILKAFPSSKEKETDMGDLWIPNGTDSRKSIYIETGIDEKTVYFGHSHAHLGYPGMPLKEAEVKVKEFLDKILNDELVSGESRGWFLTTGWILPASELEEIKRKHKKYRVVSWSGCFDEDNWEK